MKKDYTIFCPQMSPIHFELMETAVRSFGYKLEVLQNSDRRAVDTGLKYVNNDACYPSLIVVGQIMDALLSGKYDLKPHGHYHEPDRRWLPCIQLYRIYQTRAGAGRMPQIPVISLNANGMETNPGFKHYAASDNKKSNAGRGIRDLFMRVLYATRPYEAKPGSANALHGKWRDICQKSLSRRAPTMLEFNRNIRGIIKDFDELPAEKCNETKGGNCR